MRTRFFSGGPLELAMLADPVVPTKLTNVALRRPTGSAVRRPQPPPTVPRPRQKRPSHSQLIRNECCEQRGRRGMLRCAE